MTRRGETSGPDVSREGVQRDLLPLVEGSTVSTKYGMIRTDHILFIASGAFHLSKPSDLIPELQGRLPIRVELDALGVEDFVRILTEPDASLTEQYMRPAGHRRRSRWNSPRTASGASPRSPARSTSAPRISAHGACTRCMERLLETISFEAPDRSGSHVMIDAAYVNEHLDQLAKDEDLSRYIL